MKTHPVRGNRFTKQHPDTNIKPIALQIIGKPMTESLICALGEIYENNSDWKTNHPNI